MAIVHIETAGTKDVLDCVADPADRRFFLDRLQRGPAGGLAYLAFDGPEPVGCVYLRLDEAEEPELRAYLTGVPLIQRLRVFDPYQRQGIGPRLIAAVEQGAQERECGRIALGVDVTESGEQLAGQPDLIRFYRNLGYREWPRGLVETFDDERKPGHCRIFTKDL